MTMDDFDVDFDHDRDDLPEADERPPKQWEVAVYDMDRYYGGPEEGGWWYDAGARSGFSRRVFNSLEAACEYCRRMNRRFDQYESRHRISTGSMGYRGGARLAMVHPRGESPEFFPERTPRYE